MATIQEFVVALGYVIRDADRIRFETALSGSRKSVRAFTIAMTAAAAAMAHLFERAVSEGDKLYWLGQRANASVKGIKELGFAAGQLGSSFESATSAVETLGKFFLTYPGARSWMERITGPFETTDEALLKFGRAMRDAPAYLRNAYANFLGLDYNFAQALFSGEYEEQLAKRQRLVERTGHDEREFSEESTRFLNKYKELLEVIDAIYKRIVTNISPTLRRQLEGVTNYLVENGDKIASSLESSLNSIGLLASDIETKVFPPLNKLTDALGKLWESVDKFNVSGEAADRVNNFFDTAFGNALDNLVLLIELMEKVARGDWSGAWKKLQEIGNAALAPVAALFPEALKNNKPVAKAPVAGDWRSSVDYLISKGWSRKDAIGIVANLQMESGLNPGAEGDNGTAYGLAQWRLGRRAKFAQLYGKPLEGSSVQEQLDFVDWELRNSESGSGLRLRGLSSAADKAEIITRYYERPKDVEKDVRERRALASDYSSQYQGPSITQTNNITINAPGVEQIRQSAIDALQNSNLKLLRDLGTVLK